MAVVTASRVYVLPSWIRDAHAAIGRLTAIYVQQAWAWGVGHQHSKRRARRIQAVSKLFSLHGLELGLFPGGKCLSSPRSYYVSIHLVVRFPW